MPIVHNSLHAENRLQRLKRVKNPEEGNRVLVKSTVGASLVATVLFSAWATHEDGNGITVPVTPDQPARTSTSTYFPPAVYKAVEPPMVERKHGSKLDISGEEIDSPNFEEAQLSPEQQREIGAYLHRLHGERGGNTKVPITLNVYASSSDEDASIDATGSNLGQPSPNNQLLARQRSERIREFAVTYAQENNIENVQFNSVNGQEAILNTEDVTAIREMAAQYDKSIVDLVSDINNSRAAYLSEDQRQQLHDLIVARRGAEIQGETISESPYPASECAVFVEKVSQPPVVTTTDLPPSKGAEVTITPVLIPIVRLKRRKSEQTVENTKVTVSDVTQAMPENNQLAQESSNNGPSTKVPEAYEQPSDIDNEDGDAIDDNNATKISLHKPVVELKTIHPKEFGQVSMERMSISTDTRVNGARVREVIVPGAILIGFIGAAAFLPLEESERDKGDIIRINAQCATVEVQEDSETIRKSTVLGRLVASWITGNDPWHYAAPQKGGAEIRVTGHPDGMYVVSPDGSVRGPLPTPDSVHLATIDPRDPADISMVRRYAQENGITLPEGELSSRDIAAIVEQHGIDFNAVTTKQFADEFNSYTGQTVVEVEEK